MPIRTPPSLSEILAQFNAARQKTAEDGLEEPPEADNLPPESEDIPPVQAPPGDPIGAAADDLVHAARKLEQADTDKGKAEDEVVDAADALKEIALNAANGHADALSKEAQIFGKIFAESVVSELNKTAADDGGKTMQAGPMSQAFIQVKLGEVYDEAYGLALSKIAENAAYAEALRQLGYDPADPEAAAALAAAQEQEGANGEVRTALYPQSLASAASVQSGEQPDVPPSVALLQAGNATREAAEAATAAAEAVNLLMANAQGQNVDLPDLTRNAYAQTVQQLQGQA